MRTLEVLVEDPSTEQALKPVLAKIIAGRAKYALRNFNSKPRLLHNLPDRLAGYKQRIDSGEDLRVLVLVDCDDDACTTLKQHWKSLLPARGSSPRQEPLHRRPSMWSPASPLKNSKPGSWATPGHCVRLSPACQPSIPEPESFAIPTMFLVGVGRPCTAS